MSLIGLAPLLSGAWRHLRGLWHGGARLARGRGSPTGGGPSTTPTGNRSVYAGSADNLGLEGNSTPMCGTRRRLNAVADRQNETPFAGRRRS